MRRQLILFFIAGLLLVLFFTAYFVTSASQSRLQDKLDEAQKDYRQGENASTIAARKQGFNAALEIYTQLDKQYPPCLSSGKLYYNLANTYFQLGEYPYALLYYYRALALQPGNYDIQHNLDTTLEKLHLSKLALASTVQKFFFIHTYLSLPQRLQILGYLGILLLVLFSWRIISSQGFIKYFIALTLLAYVLFAGSVLYTRYVEPLQGILVKSTFLYRDKGKEYAKTSNIPSAAGLKVDILDIPGDGSWFKIVTPDGTMGYVPVESIRLISC